VALQEQIERAPGDSAFHAGVFIVLLSIATKAPSILTLRRRTVLPSGRIFQTLLLMQRP
jgi:hypothetical protein